MNREQVLKILGWPGGCFIHWGCTDCFNDHGLWAHYSWKAERDAAGEIHRVLKLDEVRLIPWSDLWRTPCESDAADKILRPQ
jgi:hypothetical protein